MSSRYSYSGEPLKKGVEMQETVVETPLDHEEYNDYLLSSYFVQMYRAGQHTPPTIVYDDWVSEWLCVVDVAGEMRELADGRPDFSNISTNNIVSIGWVAHGGTKHKVGLWTYAHHDKESYNLVYPEKLLNSPTDSKRCLKLVERRLKLGFGRSHALSAEQIHRMDVGESLIRETIGFHGWRAIPHLTHTSNYRAAARQLSESESKVKPVIIAYDDEWDDAIIINRRTYNALKRTAPKKLQRVVRIAETCLHGARSHAIRLVGVLC